MVTTPQRRAGTAKLASLASLASLARLASLALSAACATVPDAPVVPHIDPGVSNQFEVVLSDRVDLLLVIDDSNSMGGPQPRFIAQLGPLVDALAHPPDRDGDGVPDAPAVSSLHAGVVDTDLGAAGMPVRGCDDASGGDEGLLNPIRYGPAEQRHSPAAGGGPSNDYYERCGSGNELPPFLVFDSSAVDTALFVHQLGCSAELHVNGCGLEQQLEAAWRALVYHRADDRPDNTDPNAGFLRDDAVLAIVVLSDEEDGSVRDCRFAEPGTPCDDATDVYNSASTRWADTNLNLRFYMARPCGPQDPTFALDRYIDPHNPGRGFPGVHPSSPERVVFAALTGMPLRVPARAGRTDWDALLGAPSPLGADDFCGRDAARAFDDPANPEGAVSMRQANRDPNPDCPSRTVPACRLEGSVDDPARPACSPTDQYFAWPARRIIEVARRFDESPRCGGAPCHSGLVASICANDYGAPMASIAALIQSRLLSTCLPVSPPLELAGEGLHRAACVLVVELPAGVECNPALGQRPAATPRTAAGNARCDVAQLPFDASGAPVRAGATTAGWFLEERETVCPQRMGFTPGARPPPGSRLQLECAR